MPKNRFYFSHDLHSRSDKNILKVRMKHGMEGVGIYWCIVEMLHEEGGYILRSDYERISFELRTNIESITAIIELYKLFKFDEEKFWSDSALMRIDEKNKKSEMARLSVSYRKDRTGVKRSKNGRSTIKEKKRKEIIKEESIKEEISDEEKKEWDKFKIWADKHTPKLFQMKLPLQPKQLFSLKKEFTPAALLDVMQAMENTKPLLKKYDSAYLTINSWAKRREDSKLNGHTIQQEEIGGKRLKQL